jgi:hypothetical protein
MKHSPRFDVRAIFVVAIALIAPAAMRAQTDEIQVYDASIAAPGVFNITWHNNFTPDGRTMPAFPGAIIPNHSLNGVPEWALGVTPWFEAGLYLPLYSVSEGRGSTLNGFKFRMLFVSPHADQRKVFFGMNFEFSYNAKYWDPRRATSEIRPIFGWHLHPWDIIINPILDNSWTGGFKGLDFAPEERIAYNFHSSYAVAAEEYDDFGIIRDFDTPRNQSHQLFAVFDHTSKIVDVEAGIGFGMTPATDKVTLKLILSRDLNKPHKN